MTADHNPASYHCTCWNCRHARDAAMRRPAPTPEQTIAAEKEPTMDPFLSGNMHADRTTDHLARIRAGVKGALADATNLDTEPLTYQQRAEIQAARDHLETALGYVGRIYDERSKPRSTHANEES